PGELGAEPLPGDLGLAAVAPEVPGAGADGDEGGVVAAPFSAAAGDPASVPPTPDGARPALPGARPWTFAAWALVAALSLVPPEQAVATRTRIPIRPATRRPV